MQSFKRYKLSRLPKGPGVYAFKKGAKLLYIGKAVNIRERVKNHFQQPNYKDNIFTKQASQIGCIETGSEIEALVLEASLIKKYQPKYNVVWRDDKNYFYVEISKEDFPRILIVHQRKPNAKYIGPFIEGTALKRVLTFMRKVFPYYTSKKHPKSSCLWCSLKLCPGPNPDKRDYQKNIKSLISVLQGKSKKILKTLRKEMKRHSNNQDYEKAAKTREKILALERVLSHSNVLEPIIEEQGQFQNFNRIEAYDVSNIQGKDATASMVTFINGRPAKNFYRKFKIKIAGKPDDIAMLKEALARRFKHSEWPMPDLILIDGGKAQLNAAKNILACRQVGKNIPIMSLAKKENKLYMENLKDPVLLEKMPREIFNLILQLRDEAHRFAISYHRKLREKGLAL